MVEQILETCLKITQDEQQQYDKEEISTLISILTFHVQTMNPCYFVLTLQPKYHALETQHWEESYMLHILRPFYELAPTKSSNLEPHW